MVLTALGLDLVVPARASAQTPAAPPSSLPAAAALPVASGTRIAHEAALEERLRQMEDLLKRMPDPEHVRQLESTVQKLSTQVDQLSTELRQAKAAARQTTSLNGTRAGPGTAGLPGGGMSGLSAGGGMSGLAADVATDEPGGTVADVIGFGGTAAGFGQAAELPSSRFDMPSVPPNTPAQTRWGPGFQIRTADDEFDIQFHDLTELDGRFYGIRDQTPVSNTFDIARQWFVFNGHLTRPYEYYVSFNNAFDTFSALDVFLNVNYDKRIQFRFGRFKSPFCYEFYAQPTEALASGEWSVFFNNFGMNRDLGTMLWGESVAGRIDYAAGIFNSTPNAQFDLSNPKSVIAFLNFAPFRPVKDSPLENFNIGGSLVAGDQNHAPVPQELRTIVPTSGSNVIGVPFLTFNNNVVVSGPRNLWSLHAAYFYRSLMVLAEWQSGFQDYALANQTNSRVHLPIESFYVQASYFLTGERLASRGRVTPLRSFDLRPGRFGLGAWEVVGRYSFLSLGQQVFSAGLADPNNWTNRLFVTDLGINWYWNPYIHRPVRLAARRVRQPRGLRSRRLRPDQRPVHDSASRSGSSAVGHLNHTRQNGSAPSIIRSPSEFAQVRLQGGGTRDDRVGRLRRQVTDLLANGCHLCLIGFGQARQLCLQPRLQLPIVKFDRFGDRQGRLLVDRTLQRPHGQRRSETGPPGPDNGNFPADPIEIHHGESTRVEASDGGRIGVRQRCETGEPFESPGQGLLEPGNSIVSFPPAPA